MKKIFLCLCFFLSACSINQIEKNNSDETLHLTLADKIQNQVVEYEEYAISKLPNSLKDINDKDVFFAQEGIANRELNQKGAGFIKSYETADHEAMLTVFVYNNLEYGFSEDITLNLEELMEKHLAEIKMYQSTGISEKVKLGKVEKAEIKWKKKIKILEASATYEKDGEDKKTYVMLGSIPELFSYVRLRFTYDNTKKNRSFVESKRRVLMARVLTLLAEANK